MGQITRDQSQQVIATLMTNTDWSAIDFEEAGLRDIIVRRPKDAGAAFTAWLKNGCRLAVKGPATLIIDRSRPFDPATFIGRGWTIEEQDERAVDLTEINFSKVDFVNALKRGESVITGEEKLRRLKKDGSIRLDAKVGQTLYEEKGQVMLHFIHEHFNVSWFELAGTVLRNPHGNRCFLFLCRYGDGSWDWRFGWLDRGRSESHMSPVPAS